MIQKIPGEPIETTVLRSWDDCVVTCWWDEGNEWFNIRVFKPDQPAKTIRLSRAEVAKMKTLL